MSKPPKKKESENDEDDLSRFLNSMPPVEQQVLEIKSKLPVICETYTWVPRFLLTLQVSQSIRQACYGARISRAMVYRLKNAYPEFARAMAEAEEDATDWYVEEARRRALNSSDMLLKFMLQSHRPEVYAPKPQAVAFAGVKIEINGKSRVVQSANDLTDAELDGITEGTITIEGDAGALFDGLDLEEEDADLADDQAPRM